MPGGGLGLMTWSTQAESRDVTIVAGGKTLYSSASIAGADLVDPQGDWRVTNGTIAQSSPETNRTVMLKGANAPAGDYTLRFKARKIAGAEGFMVIMDSRQDGDLRWNIGGWANRETAFQRNGGVVGKSVPGHIETNRWYDVRVEREGNRTRGYLDGKLIQEIVETGAPDFALSAGIDEKTNEVVLKVVNGSAETKTTRLDLSGVRLKGTGKAIVLTGPDLLAENSFDAPNRLAPVERPVSGVVSGMTYGFAPRSVTVLRLPIR